MIETSGQPRSGRKTVLVLLPTGTPIARAALAGIRKVAERLRWRFVSVDGERDGGDAFRVSRSPSGADSVSEIAALLRPDGLVAWNGTLVPDDVRRTFGTNFPAVFIELSGDPSGAVQVFGDSASITELAARELLFTGLGDFAYVPFAGDEPWIAGRGREFARLIAVAGKRFHPFPQSSGGSGEAGKRGAAELSAFLAALPKPCGIFAANDITGERVLGACAELGLRVPQDIAVVGADDSEYICENTTPTLSSVAQDIYGEGVAAAEMLAEWMRRPRHRPPQSRSVPAARLVRRASSRLVYDDRVARALEAIRLHACDAGFGAPDVVRALCLSRAPAFRLFKRAVGRTILDEIHSARLERAMEMLSKGRRPDAVAAECGYASVANFRRVFKKHIGETVRAWTLSQGK